MKIAKKTGIREMPVFLLHAVLHKKFNFFIKLAKMGHLVL